MLRNYLLTAYRHLRRHPGYAFINVLGLAVGLACCLLIALYVQDELGYDTFLENSDRVYRLTSDLQQSGDAAPHRAGTVGWPIGRVLEAEYPEVEDVVYLRGWPTFPVTHAGEQLFEEMLYADEGFFDLFSFPAVEGNLETALAEPFSLVLSQTLAHRLFGDAPALGQPLALADTLAFTVTGVVEVPEQSHLQFDVLASFETLRTFMGNYYEGQFTSGWLNLNVGNYVLLREGADAGAFAAKIRSLPMERGGSYLEEWGSTYRLHLEPLADVFLHSNYSNAFGPQSDVTYVYLLSAIALFLLLIACINFVNLATARSMERAKEVGVRKVVGSSRAMLVRQFLSESLLTTLVALVLGLSLLSLALPLFNSLTEKTLAAEALLSPVMGGGLVALLLLVGLLGGLYPALVLSRFRPVEVMKGAFSRSRRGVRLRQALVVFQFAISCALIVSTLVVLRQLHFMKSQDPGFDEEQVLVLDARRAPGRALAQQYETLKQELAAHPAVLRTSATYAVPGRNGWRGQISFPEGWTEGEALTLEYIPVDQDFTETLGLTMVAGRDLSHDFPVDLERSVMINEAAVAAIGWGAPEEAIGKRLSSPGSAKSDGVIVGVVQNYHHHGLQEEIQPIMYGVNEGTFGLFALRLAADEAGAVLTHVAQTWERLFPGYPFDTYFLDEYFARQYEAEQRLSRIFGTFAGLAILIACLGLFGLAAFTTLQRTKEVGIRKVFGASVGSIVALLSKEFLGLVLVAFVVAAPVAYFAMRGWLEDFAYRVDLGVGTFLLAGALALLVALLTISYQAVRAAFSNPVDSLRYE